MKLAQVDAFFRHLVERRKLAQFAHHVDQFVGHVIDLFFRVEAADAEADGGMRDIVAHAQRLQHVTRLERGRRAGRAARNRDIVDAHQQRFAFHIRKAHIQAVRQAVLPSSR